MDATAPAASQEGNAVDLEPTDQQVAFRAEIRDWLEDHVPREPLGPLSTPEGFRAHREWERTLYEAGYAAISWPAAYGGRDADLITQAIFDEEYARADAPQRINALGLGLAGPTLMVYGSDAQKQRWLPRILSCEDIWSQGFSEPDAGSDLAALSTRAVRDGDHYVVDGQKIWTSLGRFADRMFTLVRTDPSVPKHHGISFLLIDLASEGVEVRPLTQINGDAGFAEVFLTDVRVPVDDLVGKEGQGWEIAMTALGFERGRGLRTHVRFEKDLAELIDLVRTCGLADDPVIRDRVAQLHIETQVYRHNTLRTLTTLAEGRPQGPEASLNKLYWSEMEVRLFRLGMDVMGERSQLLDSAEAALVRSQWQKRYWYARASNIYAGTSEVQKNIIAERVLGLPRA